MVELYFLFEEYNISIEDIKTSSVKYKDIVKGINIYNLLYAKWRSAAHSQIYIQ